MKNITVSKTFALIIVMIVLGVFLLPNIIGSVNLFVVEKHYQDEVERFERQIAMRDKLLDQSLNELNIPDSEFHRCISQELDGFKGIFNASLPAGGVDFTRTGSVCESTWPIRGRKN